MSARLALLALIGLSGCLTGCSSAPAPTHVFAPVTCGGAPLSVHFFDAGQALSVLVDLPDGRHVLVDAGESATRAACGAPCAAWHERVMAGLSAELSGAPIDLLWIKHQHTDHLGGAADVMQTFRTLNYVDNGLDLDGATVGKAREAATSTGVNVSVVDPDHLVIPIDDTDEVKLAAVVPKPWPRACRRNANDCSIMLRVDYCASSILFTGDAEIDEESAVLAEPVSLLQVGHHGSDTSTSPDFLAKVKPRYAVISAGKMGEGTNASYCHPRAETVHALTAALGGAGARTVEAFDGDVSCRGADASHWKATATSDRLWITARDGPITLVTRGDGEFSAAQSSSASNP